jgi:hypothetical protein
LRGYLGALQSVGPGDEDLRGKDGPAGGSGAVEFLMERRYVDEFRRRHDAWRIQDRRVIADLSLRHSAETIGAGDRNRTIPRRDKEDHYYAKCEELLAAAARQ